MRYWATRTDTYPQGGAHCNLCYFELIDSQKWVPTEHPSMTGRQIARVGFWLTFLDALKTGTSAI